MAKSWSGGGRAGQTVAGRRGFKGLALAIAISTSVQQPPLPVQPRRRFGRRALGSYSSLFFSSSAFGLSSLASSADSSVVAASGLAASSSLSASSVLASSGTAEKEKCTLNLAPYNPLIKPDCSFKLTEKSRLCASVNIKQTVIERREGERKKRKRGRERGGKREGKERGGKREGERERGNNEGK